MGGEIILGGKHMDYKLVFDLQTSDIRIANYLFMLPGVIVFLFGAVTYFFRDHYSNPFRARPMPQRFPFFLLLFGAVWMQLSALSLYTQYDVMDRALKTGKVRVVEGKVVQFSPMPYTGHAMERFCVSDTEACFSYSDYEVTPGFNRTTAHGGPIQAGLPVRVTYKDNTILKLEVAAPDTSFAQKHMEGLPEAALSPAR
jgi:hypothetical protein